MEIIQASVEHAEFIAKGLSHHFESLNSQFGYNKYKTAYDKIFEHVTSRLSQPDSEFGYYLLLDETQSPIGFVNTLAELPIFEILAVVLLKNYNTTENFIKLTQFAVDELHKRGADKILTEVTAKEVAYAKAIEQVGGQLIEQKYIIF